MAVDLTKVTTLLLGADIDSLIGLCETHRIVVGEDKRESKPALFTLLMRFLNSEQLEQSADGGKAIVDQIVGELEPEVKEEDVIPDLEGKAVEQVGGDGAKNVPVVKAKVDKPAEKSPFETLTYHRLQKFKVDGKIGEPGEKGCLTYSNLSFQVRQARTQYSVSEIHSGIIAAIKGGNALRDYFELAEVKTISDIMSVLRSHFNEKDPAGTLQDLRHSVQMPGQTAHAFCAQTIALRKKVAILAEEDGTTFDAELLKTTFFRAIFTGIKQNNIRMELQGLLKSRTCTDTELLAEVAAAAATEKERVEKSKAKVEVSNVSAHSDSDSDSSTPMKSNRSKKREAKMQATINKQEVRINKLTSQVENLNQRLLDPPQPQPLVAAVGAAVGAAAPGRNVNANVFRSRRINRPIFRCQACNEANSPWCAHCFKCGSDAHKRKDCPN